MILLDADLQWQAPASSGPGQRAVFRDAAIQFCLTLKCMFGLSLRQTTGLAESLIKLARLDWRMPDYSTLARHQKTLSVAIAARCSLVETKMGGIKRLGERVMARGFERQLSERQIRASILHRSTSLGTPQTGRVP